MSCAAYRVVVQLGCCRVRAGVVVQGAARIEEPDGGQWDGDVVMEGWAADAAHPIVEGRWLAEERLLPGEQCGCPAAGDGWI
ncbi:hypothetical protein ACLOJK_029529 [Asimina triloba]